MPYNTNANTIVQCTMYTQILQYPAQFRLYGVQKACIQQRLYQSSKDRIQIKIINYNFWWQLALFFLFLVLLDNLDFFGFKVAWNQISGRPSWRNDECFELLQLAQDPRRSLNRPITGNSNPECCAEVCAQTSYHGKIFNRRTHSFVTHHITWPSLVQS